MTIADTVYWYILFLAWGAAIGAFRDVLTWQQGSIASIAYWLGVFGIWYFARSARSVSSQVKPATDSDADLKLAVSGLTEMSTKLDQVNNMLVGRVMELDNRLKTIEKSLEADGRNITALGKEIHRLNSDVVDLENEVKMRR